MQQPKMTREKLERANALAKEIDQIEDQLSSIKEKDCSCIEFFSNGYTSNLRRKHCSITEEDYLEIKELVTRKLSDKLAAKRSEFDNL